MTPLTTLGLLVLLMVVGLLIYWRDKGGASPIGRDIFFGAYLAACVGLALHALRL